MKGKRYAFKRGGESDFQKHIREMIEMVKNEKVKDGDIDFDKLKMTKHATERLMEYEDCKWYRTLDIVTNLLKRSYRVGEQLAYDGRINVLFAYDQYAIYLSPNLEYVVTVHKFDKITYEPVCKRVASVMKKHKGKHLRNKLIQLHQKAWDNIEKEEQEQLKVVMEIDDKLRELESLKRGYTPRHYKKYISERMKEEDDKLIKEGEKLFSIKLEKRHIGKSITSLLHTNAKININ